MDMRILSIDEDFPESVKQSSNKYQVWFFGDRKLPESLARRCEFPNRAVLERTIKTLLDSNSDYRSNPGDFYFRHISDQVWDDVNALLYIKYFDGHELVELKDYAN